MEIPASWTVGMGSYTGTETGSVHTPDCLFAPGNYTLAAYNTPDDITVSGTTATVAGDTDHADCINGMPGWFFTSVQDVTIEADTDCDLTAVMRQQVRGLTLVIEPTGDAKERIIAVTGTLSGAAGTLDFATDTHGTASSVALAFPG